jgi:uncharacterized protein YdeI (YjbR/CyaY-like superfamily)
MRCKLGGTPECKVNHWQKELKELRRIVLDCGLTEELKWGVPCYTFQLKNILLVSAFKEFCAVSFFKGSLLSDAHRILVKPGENSQATRYAKFTHVQKIIEMESILKAYIDEAIEVEKANSKVKFKRDPGPIPEELRNKFDEIPDLKTAFKALTPGRQRGYILYFSQPKQPKTRKSRIEKYIIKILDGKGLNDN